MKDRILAWVVARPISTALLVALLLCLPSLSLPFFLDDFDLLLKSREWLGQRPPDDVTLGTGVGVWGEPEFYTFADGDPAQARALIADADVPWWADPSLRLRFFRPLSSALLLLDAALFGESSFAMHLHSTAWYLGLIALVGVLYRRTLPPGLTALALLIFAVDDAHWMPVGWLANRNALVAAVPAFAGLLAHIRWRAEGWRPGALLAAAGFMVGLLGGEAALGVFGLLLAWELFAGPGRPHVGLLPAGIIGVIWAFFYRAGGYGAFGSGMYFDPLHDPLRYAGAALTRIPILLAGQFSGIPSDLHMFEPALAPVLAGVGTGVGLGVVLLLRHAWPSLTTAEQGALRWLIPGALFALLPVIATFPLDRLLLIPSIGGAVVTAVALRHAYRALGRLRLLTLPIGFVHLLEAPLVWLLYPVFIHAANIAYLHILDNAPDWSGRHVLLLCSDAPLSTYTPGQLALSGRPMPARWSPLSMGRSAHVIERPTPTTLLLSRVDGPMLGGTFEELYHGDPSWQVGDTVTVASMTVRIDAVEDGLPTRLLLSFDRPLPDDDLLFLSLQGGTLQPIALPDVGGRVEVPWELGPGGM